MNKKLTKFLVGLFGAVTVTAIALGIGGCKDEDATSGGYIPQEPGAENPLEERILLNKKTETMDLYDTLTLYAKTENVSGTVIWESSNPAIASVENGVVTSHTQGNVIITASVGAVKASCEITVATRGQVPTIVVNKESVTLPIGNEYTITPTLQYNGKVLTAEFEYLSESDSIATIQNGKITAKSLGETNVAVTARYLDYTETKLINVTVTENVILKTSVQTVVLGTLEAAGYELETDVTVDVVENGAVVSNPTLVWASENAAIATVNAGKITAVGAGETKITATYTTANDNLFVAVIKVLVEKPILEVALENNTLDLDENTEEKISLDLSNTEINATDIEKVFDVTKTEQELAFQTENDAIVLTKADLTVGAREWTLTSEKAVYKVSVNVTVDILPLVEFNTETDAYRMGWYWNSNHRLSFDDTVKYGDENGSLKVEILKGKKSYINVATPMNTDFSLYEYMLFRVYNASERDIVIGVNGAEAKKIKSGRWGAVKVTADMFEAGQVVYPNVTGKVSMSDLTGFPICIVNAADLLTGDVFYISSIIGVGEGVEMEEIEESTTIDVTKPALIAAIGNNNAMSIFGKGGSVSASTDYVMEGETQSIKLVCGNASDEYLRIGNPTTYDISEYDYVIFNVYNPNTTRAKVGITYGGYAWCEPNQWTEVKIALASFDGITPWLIAEGDYEAWDFKTFDSTWTGQDAGWYDISDFAIRVMGLAKGSTLYISSIHAVCIEALGETEVEMPEEPVIPETVVVGAFDKSAAGLSVFSNRASVSNSTEYKYGNEVGSLKVTRSQSGEIYVIINSPVTANLSLYDYLTIRVYNPTSADVTAGYCWYGDTVCKAGEWTEIKIDLNAVYATSDSKFDNLSTGKDIPRNNIKGLALRVISGLENGESLYFSQLVAERAPEA